MTSALPYALEKRVAITAVLRACTLTQLVFNNLVKGEKLVKGDKSPVTVGDFGAQAVVNTILGQAFPNDPIVGEEDSADLRGDEAGEIRRRVVELANNALVGELKEEAGEEERWGIGPGKERVESELLDVIDRGMGEGGSAGRMWTLDPIDGTKGFVRGEQFAVCLALIVDGVVQLGVMGCPNLPVDASKPDGERGCLFVAVRGQGAEQRSLSNSNPKSLKIPTVPIKDLAFLESVEKAHAALDVNAQVSKALGLTREPIRMDSQAKYCALARGDGGAYLRLPTGTGYREKIWDHAAGSILVEEAGGVISDSRGYKLEFGLGRTLGENFGVVAAAKEAHQAVVEAIKSVQG